MRSSGYICALAKCVPHTSHLFVLGSVAAVTPQVELVTPQAASSHASSRSRYFIHHTAQVPCHWLMRCRWSPNQRSTVQKFSITLGELNYVSNAPSGHGKQKLSLRVGKVRATPAGFTCPRSGVRSHASGRSGHASRRRQSRLKPQPSL